MKKEYFTRELGFFLAGTMFGMGNLFLYVVLSRNGYERAALIIFLALFIKALTAFSFSKLLRGLHEIDDMEQADNKRQQLEQENAQQETAKTEVSKVCSHRNDDSNNLADQWVETLRQQPATGLTFPYATKELEAMRAAALAFWQDYDPNRPPLQKQVQQFIAEQAGGMSERKAKELATIIKPEAQRDA